MPSPQGGTASSTKSTTSKTQIKYERPSSNVTSCLAATVETIGSRRRGNLLKGIVSSVEGTILEFLGLRRFGWSEEQY
jgi:hypothetical protein